MKRMIGSDKLPKIAQDVALMVDSHWPFSTDISADMGINYANCRDQLATDLSVESRPLLYSQQIYLLDPTDSQSVCSI